MPHIILFSYPFDPFLHPSGACTPAWFNDYRVWYCVRCAMFCEHRLAVDHIVSAAEVVTNTPRVR